MKQEPDSRRSVSERQGGNPPSSGEGGRQRTSAPRRAPDIPVEPGLPDGWWEDDPRTTALEDRRYWTDRDED